MENVGILVQEVFQGKEVLLHTKDLIEGYSQLVAKGRGLGDIRLPYRTNKASEIKRQTFPSAAVNCSAFVLSWRSDRCLITGLRQDHMHDLPVPYIARSAQMGLSPKS